MNQFAKYLIIGGIFLLFVGCMILFRDRIPFIKYLGHLPGDIRVEKDSFNIYFPITTSLLLSLVLSIVVFVSTARFGGGDSSVEVTESPKDSKLLFESSERKHSEVKLPEVEFIVDLKLKRGTPVYLGRDDLLVDLSLFVPTSGTMDFEGGELQEGEMTLKDGSQLRFFMSSVDSLYLVPQGADPKKAGQLFIRSK